MPGWTTGNFLVLLQRPWRENQLYVHSTNPVRYRRIWPVGAIELQRDSDDVHCSKAYAPLRHENVLDQRRLEGAQLGRADSRRLAVNDEDTSVRLLLLV